MCYIRIIPQHCSPSELKWVSMSQHQVIFIVLQCDKSKVKCNGSVSMSYILSASILTFLILFHFFHFILYFPHIHIQVKKETLDVEIAIFDAIKSNVNTEENSLNVDVVQQSYINYQLYHPKLTINVSFNQSHTLLTRIKQFIRNQHLKVFILLTSLYS